ncbi:hypothetical protein DMX06_07740 [Pseudomonas mosselii]|nr:hypothetical protein DMX06_07740 [Pseudomonas mosselii]
MLTEALVVLRDGCQLGMTEIYLKPATILGLPANTGKAGAIHRGVCFAGKPAPTGSQKRAPKGPLSFCASRSY